MKDIDIKGKTGLVLYFVLGTLLSVAALFILPFAYVAELFLRQIRKRSDYS